DGKKNGGETDVDCGGPDCDPCAVGKACAASADCEGGACVGGECAGAAAACTDAVKDANETDVDCGGPDCAPCAVGKGCERGPDCESGLCVNNVCGAGARRAGPAPPR